MDAERRRRDRGAGLFSTSFGLLFFLGFLFFAVQLLVNLYATSVVTSVTYDTARRVAVLGRAPTQADEQGAIDRARQQLGSMGQNATFSFTYTADPTNPAVPSVVKLYVKVDNPRFINQLVGNDTIERTVEVRAERQT